MGSDRQHHYDVRRADQCIHCEKRTTRLDNLYHTTCFLLFNDGDANQQSDDFFSRQIIYREENDPLWEMVAATLILGLVFILLQWLGFRHLWATGTTLHGSGAGQFLYIIAGLHALHVFGGVIALFVLWLRARNTRIRSYNMVPVDVVSTYWHFVDLLWIYLFIFFLMVQ